jgi:hypothetical protein
MRKILTVSSLALWSGCALTQDRPPWPTDGWVESTAAEQGIDPVPFLEFHSEIEADRYGNVDRFVVVCDGYLVVDRRYEHDYRAITRGRESYIGYGEGAEPDAGILPDFNYFDPATHPFYGDRDVHTLQSVTKSISSALIGIAIGRGEIKGVHAPLLSYFADYDLSRVDSRLGRATLEDLLTMRSGIEWHENDRPYGDTNTTSLLERAQDWIQFTLDQPMDTNPGEKWAYNSGGSQLMSGVIKAATGEFADAYAEKHLFGPLGIQDYHWKKTPKGYPDTLGGLYLAADQLAKIGYLFLHNGVWDDERILPEGWVAASTERHVERVSNRGSRGYGYQWWRVDREGVVVWAGLGFGGQSLLVLPDRGIVGVVNSWNIFGARVSSVIDRFLDALIAASR